MGEETESGKMGGLAKLLGWPLVAIVFMLLFFSPIKNWLGGQGKASEITVGALAIKFAPEPSSSSSLNASPDIADPVSQLSPAELDFLLGRPPGQTTLSCVKGQLSDDEFVQGQREEFESEARNWAKLENLRLVSSSPDEDSDYCKPGGMRAYILTKIGESARGYVIRVATQVLKFEKAG